ncbi:MAG: hypothetical protein H7Y60_03760 [Rhodospirillaceae bacterium]|nr:hypothetical protein [Rhodospirillales bacterium]
MADGGFAIAYATYSGIEVQRFDAASVATGTPIQADYPGNYDTSPTISGLPDGGLLMTWMGYRMDPSDPWNDGIAVRRFDADGLPLGEPQQVNTESYGNQGAMSVAVLADGGWVVTWSSDKDDMQDIYGQVYNSDGTLRGGEIHLANAGYQFAPSVSALDDGGFIVAWGSDDIVAQRFDAQGTASGDQFVVNQNLAGEQGAPMIPTPTTPSRRTAPSSMTNTPKALCAIPIPMKPPVT